MTCKCLIVASVFVLLAGTTASAAFDVPNQDSGDAKHASSPRDDDAAAEWTTFSSREAAFSIQLPKRLPAPSVRSEGPTLHVTTGEEGFAVTIGVVDIPSGLADRYSPANIEAVTKEVLDGFVLGYADQGQPTQAIFDRSFSHSGTKAGEGHVVGLPQGRTSYTRVFISGGRLYSVTVGAGSDRASDVTHVFESFSLTPATAPN